MAHVKKLKDSNNETIYPVTITDAIYSNNEKVSDILNNFNSIIQKLEEYESVRETVKQKLTDILDDKSIDYDSDSSLPELLDKVLDATITVDPWDADKIYVIQNGKFVNSDEFGSPYGTYITQQSDHVAVKCGYNTNVYESITKSVDLINYSKICFTVASTLGYTPNLYLFWSDVAVSQTTGGQTPGAVYQEECIAFNIPINYTTYTVDIELIDVALYYGLMSCGQSSTGNEFIKIKELYFEK